MRKFLVASMLAVAVLFLSGTEASAKGPIRQFVGNVAHRAANATHIVAYRVTHPFNGYFAGNCGCSNVGCTGNCTACPSGQCPTTFNQTYRQNTVIRQSGTCPNGVCPTK